MRSINKVILIGNLTRDPEMRQTPNGQSVATFGMATNREWVTKNGEHNNSAEFHECVVWAHLAEICTQYLKKGNLIYVEGYLKTRNWDSPEGIKKFKTEIVVQDMIRLEKRPAGEHSEHFHNDQDRHEHSPHSEFSEPAQNENPAPEDNSYEPNPNDNAIEKDLGL